VGELPVWTDWDAHLAVTQGIESGVTNRSGDLVLGEDRVLARASGVDHVHVPKFKDDVSYTPVCARGPHVTELSIPWKMTSLSNAPVALSPSKEDVGNGDEGGDGRVELEVSDVEPSNVRGRSTSTDGF